MKSQLWLVPSRRSPTTSLRFRCTIVPPQHSASPVFEVLRWLLTILPMEGWMTGPPAAWPRTQSATSVSRSAQTVLVRMADGALATRVSIGFAETLLDSGKAQPIGKRRLRYLRLKPGIVLTESSAGWALIEEERRKHVDNAVCRAIMVCDHRAVR